MEGEMRQLATWFMGCVATLAVGVGVFTVLGACGWSELACETASVVATLLIGSWWLTMWHNELGRNK